ncbi:TPA: hypothetical protein KFJ78_000974 [Escherichia coli]|nr:hypothetical protein [Escherichia coli]HBC9527049.1 hypothetical protein [Escherichia coli]
MNTITKERLQWLANISGRDDIDDIDGGEIRELALIALASLEAEPVAECIVEDGGMCIDGFGEYVGHSLPDGTHQLYTAPPAPVVPDDWQLVPKKITLEMECALSKADSYEIGWLWALAAAPKYEVQNAKRVQNALNACRAAMLQSQGEGNPHVTPARLPGGFTIEDAKELHEDLVRSHISQALSGEKMKKNDRDADLRWIHGVIVQAAWFVKASLDALPEPLREEKGGSANCTASHGTTDNPPVPGKQTDELTMLVKQLVSQLKKVKPDCKLPDKAMDYLKRNELISAEDVLR